MYHSVHQWCSVEVSDKWEWSNASINNPVFIRKLLLEEHGMRCLHLCKWNFGCGNPNREKGSFLQTTCKRWGKDLRRLSHPSFTAGFESRSRISSWLECRLWTSVTSDTTTQATVKEFSILEYEDTDPWYKYKHTSLSCNNRFSYQAGKPISTGEATVAHSPRKQKIWFLRQDLVFNHLASCLIKQMLVLSLICIAAFIMYKIVGC